MTKTGVVMDKIETISPKKDTTLGLMLEAQKRGHELYYMTIADIYLKNGIAFGMARKIEVFESETNWYKYRSEYSEIELGDLDLILMRKDPPFDDNYIYMTYVLEKAHTAGCKVVNNPVSVRNANEKLMATHFPQCCPQTMIDCNPDRIRDFVNKYGEAVIKPLDGMGGSSIFKLEKNDKNTNVIIETVTQRFTKFVMVQEFIPEISNGDKRILIINGKPVPYGLSRIPADGEFRGNLAAGGRGESRELTDKELWICEQVIPELIKRELQFVGIDVIGGYLTEVNVTSPTCMREIERERQINIACDFFDGVETDI